MAEPLRSYSSDVPEFDTYPSSPEDAIGRTRMAEVSSFDALEDERLDLDAVAREIGGTLGRAAVKVMDTKDQIIDRVDHATYDLRCQVAETTNKYVDLAKEKTAQYVDVTKATIEDARERTRHLTTTATRDYPIHVILGAAALGLLAGAGLRAWRENRG
jgi:hypothetical protein